MKHFIKLIILTVCLSCSPAYAGKIIKWVDKNGVTHYGDKPPAANKAKRSSVLNKQGVTVERIEQKKISSKDKQSVAEQSRYDNALLASYNSADEIDLAKERNTKIDKLALATLEQKLLSLKEKLASEQQLADGRQKKNQPVSEDTLAKIKQTEKQINSTEQKIALRKETIEKINLRYDQDKQRYIELRAKEKAVKASNNLPN